MASNNFSEVEQAILLTLLYSEIFNFPLTSDELWKFLISEKKIKKKIFSDSLKQLEPMVLYKNGYYYLQGKEELVEKTKKQQIYVPSKLKLAKKAAFYLSHIPTVRFIGVSGGLAMKNVTREDDIDFFIIVQKNTIFVTRFWILCVLEWLGLRRKRNDKNPADKICVNLLIDERKLAWPEHKRDIYTAHEIAQLLPLFQRDETYQNFIKNNTWINTILINCQNEQSIFLHNKGKIDYQILRILGGFFFSPVHLLRVYWGR